MLRHTLLSLTVILSIAPAALAQSDTLATLEIATENVGIYRHDVFDAARLATEAGPVTPLPLRSFMHVTWIADVVAVNGLPAKGTMMVRGIYVALNPNPNPGTGVADTTNSLAGDWIFDIQRADGSPVGTIMASGWAFGARSAGYLPPGQGNLAVLGGTGAFLGLRGQGKEAISLAGPRQAISVTEDPSNRRLHGGSTRRWDFQLMPMARPDFVRSADTTGVFHSDFTPVTASNPARRGEVLIAAATGLGPTRPGKQPGALFTADNLQEVASPIQVLVNGTAVNASNQVGWPGTTGTYRVDFRVPEEASPGMATLQLIAAWIPGSTIQVPVR
jgi:uncharacterized protein (TIGR03437 family)